MVALTRNAITTFEVPTELLGQAPDVNTLYFELHAMADANEYTETADFRTREVKGVAFRFSIELVEANLAQPALGKIAIPAGVRTGTLTILSEQSGYEGDGLLRYTDTFIVID